MATYAELIAEDERDPLGYERERLESLKHWKYDPKYKTLDLGPDGSIYCVELSRCNSNAQIVNWLCQIAMKGWATPEVVGELLIALNALLNPQGHLCGGGTDRGAIDSEKLAAARYSRMLKGGQ